MACCWQVPQSHRSNHVHAAARKSRNAPSDGAQADFRMMPPNDLVVTTYGPPIREQPLVSVLMITYNHEQFICEAIKSVFAQDFDGQMELVIGEDCSTDNTRILIEELCRDSAIPVRLISSTRNVGMHSNFRRTLSACSGRYVALIEGDDKWIERSKTQQQVRALEGDDSISMVFSRCEILNLRSDTSRFGPTGTVLPIAPAGQMTILDMAEFDELVPTATVLLKKSAVEKIPAWADNLPWMDMTLWLLASLHGKAVLQDGCLAVYRVGMGASSRFVPVEEARSRAELIFRACRLARRDVAAELLDKIGMRLQHQISWIERERGLSSISQLLRLRILAAAHAGRLEVGVVKWWMKSIVAKTLSGRFTRN